MPLVSMKEMLNKAKAESYAVGQFNLNNLELLKRSYKQQKKRNLLLYLVFPKVPLVTWVDLKPLSDWLQT
ncbi:fructose-bisphosphate aldolase class II [Bacillus sp. JCM 19045]|nr:fructose-bisphosphate aldolase class II [Bacillus sp. JCM 19045]